MAEFHYSVEMEFDGTESERAMLESLLDLMNKGSEDEYGDSWTGESFEDLDYEKEQTESGTYRYSISPADLSVQHAAFGTLDDRGEDWEKEHNWPRYFPEGFDLDSAPKLIARLFPSASFFYRATFFDSRGGGTDVIAADYRHGIFIIKSYNVPYDLTEQEEEQREENGLSDDYFYPIIENRIKGRKIKNLGIYRGEIDNDKYIKSFFDGNDLMAYLVSEQIKKDDITVAPWLDRFTSAQIMSFIIMANEADVLDVKALLMEYKNAHFGNNDPEEENIL